MPNDKLYSIGIAQAGVYGRGHNSHGPPSSITTYDTRLERYYCRLQENGYVIDKRNVSDDLLIHNVISGPMDDPSLPLNTIHPFMSDARAYMGEKLGSFDNVSSDIYKAFWKKLGARIGHRKGNLIEWDNGASEPIINFED